MSIVEYFLKTSADKQLGDQPADQTHRRFVTDFIAQHSTFRMTLNDVTVAPTFERPFNLDVFKQIRPIIDRVLRHPLLFEQTQHVDFNYGARSYVRNFRCLDYSCPFPTVASVELVRQVVHETETRVRVLPE